MDKKKKLFLSLLICAITIILISLFWRKNLLLIFILLILFFIKHYFLPIKKEIIIYIIFGLIGAFGESLIMFSGAWVYTQIHILNFPLWLPFVWGMAGITGVSIYESVT